ncbi:helicase, partial [Halobacteriales archaeon SW_7_68_16]
VVIGAPFGHRINETLGRAISALVGQRVGATVGLDAGPYRIELDLPSGVRPSSVVETIETTDPDHLRAIVELSTNGTDGLKFRLTQVAAKFGALKRWEGDGISGDRLLAMLEDTPVYEEALREVFHEDLDVTGAKRVLERVQSGEIATETVGERTPIGTGGRSGGTELLSPENADAGVIDTVRDRIADDRVILACLHCRTWSTTKPVRRVSDRPACPECESTRIAALNPWDDETVRAIQSEDRDEEDRNMVERAYHAASLVQSHGRRAVVALAGRGIGPHTAARIINNHREDDREFYRDILAEERQYARTQSFWD